MKKFIFITPLLLALAACEYTVDASDLSEGEAQKVQTCTDSRTQESITFRGSDVIEGRASMNPDRSYIKFKDVDGTVRVITGSDEPYWACVTLSNDQDGDSNE